MSELKKAGVALNDWKLPVFKQVFDEAGYSYEQKPGLVPDSVTLMVEYIEEDINRLEKTVRKANKQAAKKRFELKRKHRNGQNKDFH